MGLAAIAVVIVVAGYFLMDRWRGSGEIEATPLKPTFTKLTSQPGVELLPSLSPDGRSFIFSSGASGNWDIYLQRVGGEKAINLTEDSTEEDIQASFSPDGDFIAFRSEREDGGIFIMGATGESVRRLTDFGFNPSWSPDGREILIATEGIWTAGSRTSQSELWAIDVVTGEKLLITEGDAVQAHYSPHGDRIAYWRTTPGTGLRDILTIPANGGEPVPVTDDPDVSRTPHLILAECSSGYFACSVLGGIKPIANGIRALNFMKKPPKVQQT